MDIFSSEEPWEFTLKPVELDMNPADAAAVAPAMTLDERRAFLRLPIPERQRRMKALATVVADVYERENETEDRRVWQGGDLVEHAQQ